MRHEDQSWLYELRLAPIGEPGVCDRVAQVVAQRFPPHDVSSVVLALGGAGFATRVQLTERDAPELLRDLYAAGAPPVGVVLRPLEAAARPGTEEAGAFEAFAHRDGRFVPTWNWAAFLFGPLWYFRKGLYVKGLVLLMLSLVPIGTLSVTLLFSVTILVYCGMAGNWDHYLWKVRRSQWW